MTVNLLFSSRWVDRPDLAEFESKETAASMSELGIFYGDIPLTTHEQRADDGDGITVVKDRTLLPAHALGLWLGWNFYRLLHEPVKDTPDIGWHCAHDMSNVGDGYIWPPITIYSDGKRTALRPKVLEVPSADWIRYTSSVPVVMPTEEFQRSIWEYLKSCVDHLDGKGSKNTPLHRVYEELLEESRDHNLLTWRKLEALMGFDPDEAPESLLDIVRPLENFLGEDALEELAANGVDSLAPVERFKDWIRDFGADRTIMDTAHVEPSVMDFNMPAWRAAQDAASICRTQWRLADGEIKNAQLAELYGVSRDILDNHTVNQDLPASFFSVADRKVVLHRRNVLGRRFAIARLIGDEIFCRSAGLFFVATESKTYRQKFQRAFAAELLCPTAQIMDYLGGKTGEERISDAAAHFAVSERVVENALRNHGDMEPLDRCA